MNWKFRTAMLSGLLLSIAAVPLLRVGGQQPQISVPAGGQPPSGFLPISSTASAVTLPGLPTQEATFAVPFTTKTADGKVVEGVRYYVQNAGDANNTNHEILRDWLLRLKNADASSSDRKDARDAIEKHLKEQFEQDQKQRREQIDNLENQVSKLRKQLEKREQSQSKIIELRMQLLDNDSEGLSFPESFNDLQRLGSFSEPNGNYIAPTVALPSRPSDQPQFSNPNHLPPSSAPIRQ